MGSISRALLARARIIALECGLLSVVDDDHFGGSNAACVLEVRSLTFDDNDTPGVEVVVKRGKFNAATLNWVWNGLVRQRQFLGRRVDARLPNDIEILVGA